MSEHQYISNPEKDKKVNSESGSNKTNTSIEGASHDFGNEVIEFKSLQLAADDSLRSKNLNNLQAKADDYINNDFNGIVQLQSIADARENSQTNDRKLADWLDNIIDSAIEALNYHESVDQSWLPFDHLLYLQKKLEYYRDNCSPEYWEYYSESWRELHTAVISEIRSVNDSVVPSDGSVGTGTDLAFSMQPSLQSLAMAIGVRNQGAGWNQGDIAENHYKKIEEQRDQDGINFRLPALNLGADNEESIERKAELVDKIEVAVCSEFAAAAANILKGKGVRVEICGSIEGHHNFVVVGRPQGSNIGDKSTWGNAAIVDCWMGALWWRVGESYPDVVYVPTEHEFPISAVAWDSDSQQAEASGGDAASDRPKGGIGNLLTSFKLRKTGIDTTK